MNAVASDKVDAVLVPFSTERITILTGEKALTALGLKEGVVKGDVGLIAADKDEAARDSFAGQCAVVKFGPGSSVCELITQKGDQRRRPNLLQPPDLQRPERRSGCHCHAVRHSRAL